MTETPVFHNTFLSNCPERQYSSTGTQCGDWLYIDIENITVTKRSFSPEPPNIPDLSDAIIKTEAIAETGSTSLDNEITVSLFNFNFRCCVQLNSYNLIWTAFKVPWKM